MSNTKLMHTQIILIATHTVAHDIAWFKDFHIKVGIKNTLASVTSQLHTLGEVISKHKQLDKQ